MTLNKKQEPVRDFDAVKRTTCRNCPAGCGVKVFLRGPGIVDIFGDEEHPANKGSFCPKGLLSYYHLGNLRRVVEPRIRESLDRPFEAVTWDAALEFTAGRLRELGQRHGPDSLFVLGREVSPTGYLLGGDNFAGHFGTPYGPSAFFPRPFGGDGAVARMFGVPGSGLLMNTPRDWCNARCILVYHSDLAASDPITFGPVIDARDRGTPVLAIDSRSTVTASRATFSLRVRPGGGAAALKGIVRILLQDGLVDEEFIEDATTGLAGLRAAVEEFTPERVAQAAWVSPGDLAKAAGMVGGAKPLAVLAGDWNSRAALDDEELSMCAALVSLRGSVGIPGGGLNLLDASPFAGQSRAPGADIPASLEQALLDSGRPVGAIICHGNPRADLAGGSAARAAFDDVPLVVHLSCYANETFDHAHVSLPMSYWLEYSDLIAHGNARAVQWHNRVAAPPGACRSPLDFWTGLADACGLGAHFPWRNGDARADPRAAMDHFLAGNPLTRALSVDKLDPERNPPGGVLWPCVEEAEIAFEESRFIKGEVRGRNILFARGENYPLADRRFPTPSGRIELCDPEKPAAPAADDTEDGCHPLILITGCLVDRVEEFGFFVSDRGADATTSTVQLHPRLGGLLALANGDTVVVENGLGSFAGPVWLSESIDPRVIWCPDGIDSHHPGFTGDGPRSLFAAPDRSGGRRPCAMVTAYREGSDRAQAGRRLEELSGGLGRVECA
jgi:anaerobic selenocysteine-containing dehydrogenase